MKSISKNKNIWSPFIKGVNRYNLIDDGDKIAVCVSGGKDSFALAICMKELARQSKLAGRQNFEVIFLCMDPGYKKDILKKIKDNAKLLDIPLEFFKSNIFDVVENVGGSPCYLCARMRRGNLYAEAKSRGCNKIALAHHMDDIAETIMMNLLYNAKNKGMPHKLQSKNFENMTLIRPFSLLRERDIISWRDSNELSFISSACPLGACEKVGKRKQTKILLSEIEKANPVAVLNIYKSMLSD